MNYKAMEWAFTQPLADSSAKFLLVAIAGHAGRDLSCFPSYSQYTLIMKYPEDNLSGGYSQNGVTIRDNNKNNNNNSSSISYGGDKMADGEVDWTAMGAQALGHQNGRDDS